jgi:hypothetical protein
MEGTLKKLLTIFSLMLLLSFTFNCRKGEESAEETNRFTLSVATMPLAQMFSSMLSSLESLP